MVCSSEGVENHPMELRGSATSSPSTTAAPWTSALYVAAASLLYTLVLLNYLFQLVGARRAYKAGKPFPFNPATIALVATATKIPSDVTRAPPGLFDHLLRLTGIFLFCVTMSLSLSSLALMEDSSNMLALAVYLATEMIYLYTNTGSSASPFRPEEVLFSGVMCLLFLIMVSHCFAVPAVRRRIENKFRHRSGRVLRKWENPQAQDYSSSRFSFEELREDLEKHWWMAVTSNPDLALRAWGTPLVCAVLTWGVVGLAFVCRIALLANREGRRWRVHLIRSGNERLAGLVFLLHAISILTGLAACLLQGLYFNPVLSLYRRRKSPFGAEAIVEELLRVDFYRLEALIDWRYAPLSSRIRHALSRKVLGAMKIQAVKLLKLANLAVIWGSNLVLTILALVIFVPTKLLSSRSGHVDDDEADGDDGYDIRLRRSKHERMDRWRWRRFHSRWIESERNKKKKRTDDLLSFLKTYSSARRRLYREKVPRIVLGEYPPHSWTLTVLALALIIDRNFREEERELQEAIAKMKRAVVACMELTKLVDVTLGSSGFSQEMREAVERITDELDLSLDSRFFALLLDIGAVPAMILDGEESFAEQIPAILGGFPSVQAPSVAINVHRDPETSKEEETPGDPDRAQGTVTGKIQREAERRIKRMMDESVTDRSPDLFVANCVYRVAAGLNSRAKKRASGGKGGGGMISLRAFQQYLADTMLACLTMLPLALLRLCSTGAFGRREARAKAAAVYLGQVEGILLFIRGWHEAQSSKSKDELQDEMMLDRIFQVYEDDWANDLLP